MGKKAKHRAAKTGARKSSLGNTQNPSASLVSLFGGGPTAAGATVSDATALKVSVVYACVRVIAEDIAKLPADIWRARKDGTGWDRAKDHPLYAILRRPNRFMTPTSFFMAMGASLGFRGNAISVILRDDRGIAPVGLWPVNPGQVTIYESVTGELFYAISRRTTLENAVLRNTPIMVPAYDIMHVRGFTLDGMVGLSPLAQMRESIGIAIAGESMSAGMLANGAQPGGVLRHPEKITEEAANRLRSSWQSQYGGSANSGKTVILEEGMEFQQLGMTSVDAQFLDQRKFTIEEIARAFRIPLHMIGMLDRMTNNNVEQLNRSYYDQTLMVLIKAIEDQFRLSFDLPDDLEVEFDVNGLLRADFKTRQEGAKTQAGGGALSINEWRRAEGMNDMPGGNVWARPLNTAFVDSDGNVVSVTPPNVRPSNEENPQ